MHGCPPPPRTCPTYASTRGTTMRTIADRLGWHVESEYGERGPETRRALHWTPPPLTSDRLLATASSRSATSTRSATAAKCRGRGWGEGSLK
ncbi:Hypothetical protein NTJ_01580 [Nesidiocoris tenuis]|uniref:Uncharacterized protein n=1 Tax=Nesidiocoris tenuis TaxID=355587 RepID=A0ABN7AC00_9HEMI|nr:Hypothetical protein NTJ_01580 [Nesidiocoris tenuis]